MTAGRRLGVAALAATLLMAVPGPGRAHMSDACFAHVLQMFERMTEYEGALGDTSQLLRTYGAESQQALADGTIDSVMSGFSRFMSDQLPSILKRFTDNERMSNRIIDKAITAIDCAVREGKPPANAAPDDLEWLDGVLSGLDERTPEPVELGADCTEPFVVGLPDEVLTECEAE